MEEVGVGCDEEVERVEKRRTVIKGMREFGGRICCNAEKGGGRGEERGKMWVEGRKGIDTASGQMECINETVVCV